MDRLETITIDKIVKLVISAAAPEKILLFGSRARGDHARNSDIDILILKKKLKNARKLTANLYKSFLAENISVPVDLLAIDYDRYAELKNENGYIYKTIAREGQVLYG
ncbi:putative nucleotidyltransferases [Candidatus Termititenax aidoneus]|uniref:Nucleotidyltransferases n=1 Tax=Termititenax aidoneus TaxID=2218524 RepID=A0A388T8W8_TERA1|nr:putative nucleotidyltransferases [Candidatus Termititenax aidoneus]